MDFEANFTTNRPKGSQVVISGISGLYPQCHNVQELSDVLYNKINPVNNENCRWDSKHPEITDYFGKIPTLDLFDAEFFKVNYRLCNIMDSMSRKVLEQTYQALYDAGLNTSSFNGKKVAVFIGNSYAESEKIVYYTCNNKTGFGITGCSKAMFANRISYWLNLKGPSIVIDQMSCSSAVALQAAVDAINRGECEAAIVGGAHINLHPHICVHMDRICKICMDGKTKAFDEKADGFALSDAINVMILQKARDAKRVYAEVVHVKSEFTEGSHTLETLYRDPNALAMYLNDFYKEARIPPQMVEYVEAYGSAIPKVDKCELEAFEKVYCKNRKTPLMVGSVMSNIGCTESASTLASITKVLLGYQKGMLAGNLNCDSPRQDITSIRDGRMKILTDHHRFNRTYASVNTLSVSGLSGHVLLKGHFKPKDLMQYKSSIPRLVVITGRQDTAVQKILDYIKSKPIDPEEITLLLNIHKNTISGHLGRGYVILDTDENQQTVCLAEESKYFDDLKRPLWFVYSGMGSQWAGMGTKLLQIPIFAAAVERCRKVLEPKGLDLINILTNTDKSIFDNVMHSFVGIATVQIGLTDVLTAIGIVPDNIIGHSVGELGCAYADGSLTAEEMILAAYYRGLASLETELIRGAMAAVGLGYQDIKDLLPPEVDVACHNSTSSSTISGPEDIINKFVVKLTNDGIFANEVPCSNIAYHSRYIADAGPNLLKNLKSLVKSKPRSDKWVSTSIPEKRWKEPSSKLCSAEYLTNNLLNPVLFEETTRLVPPNAILIEIAPHGLLQAILKRSLPENCCHVPLTRRGHKDNSLFLLEAIARLFMEGIYPEIENLYPKIQFPVSTETPLLSHLVEWAYGESWHVPLLHSCSMKTTASCKYILSYHDDELKYIRGNVFRGNVEFPFSATLTAVWDTLAMVLNAPKKELSVEFRDVHLWSQPILRDQTLLKLYVMINRGNSKFEVINEKSLVASGYIFEISEKEKNDLVSVTDKNLCLDSATIYQILHEKDYSYMNEFRNIVRADSSLTEAEILWNNNWVTFLNGLFQLNILKRSENKSVTPYRMKSLIIDPETQFKMVTNMAGGDTNIKSVVLKAYVCDASNVTRCGGVTLDNLSFNDLPELKKEAFVLKPLTLISRESNIENIGETNMTLKISQIGNLNSLQWVTSSVVKDRDGLPVVVHYAGVNDMDAKRAMGLYSFLNQNSKTYGMDFSGITEKGVRVMGLAPNGTLKKYINVPQEMLWPVPKHWTLEDAATVPLAYALAFYCLGLKVKFRRGLKILVLGGAGALGQAVISVALAYDCTVFTTVGDHNKKKFLLKLFPKLKAEHVGNSHIDSFGDIVLSQTHGGGCDVVICCAQDSLKKECIRCCGAFSIILDLVQIVSNENYEYGMSHLDDDKNYMKIDLASIFDEQNLSDRQALQMMIAEGISRGYVRPLSRTTFGILEAPRAFNLVASRRQRGRVLMQLKDSPFNLRQRLSCSADKSQLVVFNSDLGILFVNRLIQSGAKNILLHTKSPTNRLTYNMRLWEQSGVQFKLVNCDLATSDVTNKFLKECSKLGGIEGIFIIATNSDPEAVTSKVVANLDKASRNMALRYFVVLSVGELIGQETCISRLKHNLPATALKIESLKTAKPNSRDVDGLSHNSVFDALEEVINSAKPIWMVTPQKRAKRSLVQELLYLADIKNVKEHQQHMSLEDLGMNRNSLPAICAYLSNFYNISLTEDYAATLNLSQIHEIEELVSHEKVFPELFGLGTFFSLVDEDELLATSDPVVLPTLSNPFASKSVEASPEGDVLCIIPGLEGHYHRFRSLCERLKIPALIRQHGIENFYETSEEKAQRYAATELQMLKNKKSCHFYLMGYESGVLIALIMAGIFEEHGITGTVYCMGGTPEEFQATLKEHLTEFKSEEELQNGVIRQIFALIAKKTDKLEETLMKYTTWEEKLKMCSRLLLGIVPHSMQYVQSVMEATYTSIKQVGFCNAKSKKLKSQLILLHAKDMVRERNVTSKELLQRYSVKPVIIYELDTPLAYIAQDLRCSAIINRHLGDKLLKEFENRNHCDKYLYSHDATLSICIV